MKDGEKVLIVDHTFGHRDLFQSKKSAYDYLAFVLAGGERKPNEFNVYLLRNEVDFLNDNTFRNTLQQAKLNASAAG